MKQWVIVFLWSLCPLWSGYDDLTPQEHQSEDEDLVVWTTQDQEKSPVTQAKEEISLPEKTPEVATSKEEPLLPEDHNQEAFHLNPSLGDKEALVEYGANALNQPHVKFLHVDGLRGGLSLVSRILKEKLLDAKTLLKDHKRFISPKGIFLDKTAFENVSELDFVSFADGLLHAITMNRDFIFQVPCHALPLKPWLRFRLFMDHDSIHVYRGDSETLLLSASGRTPHPKNQHLRDSHKKNLQILYHKKNTPKDARTSENTGEDDPWVFSDWGISCERLMGLDLEDIARNFEGAQQSEITNPMDMCSIMAHDFYASGAVSKEPWSCFRVAMALLKKTDQWQKDIMLLSNTKEDAFRTYFNEHRTLHKQHLVGPSSKVTNSMIEALEEKKSFAYEMTLLDQACKKNYKDVFMYLKEASQQGHFYAGLAIANSFSKDLTTQKQELERAWEGIGPWILTIFQHRTHCGGFFIPSQNKEQIFQSLHILAMPANTLKECQTKAQDPKITAWQTLAGKLHGMCMLTP